MTYDVLEYPRYALPAAAANTDCSSSSSRQQQQQHATVSKDVVEHHVPPHHTAAADLRIAAAPKLLFVMFTRGVTSCCSPLVPAACSAARW